MNTEAANIILERGVRFKLPAPLGLRVPITIRPLRLGTLYEMSRLTAEHKLEDQLLSPPLPAVAEVIAAAVLNNRLLIRLFLRPMAQWLLNSLTAKGLTELYAVVRRMSDPNPFTAITVSLVATAKALTELRAGRETEGS